MRKKDSTVPKPRKEPAPKTREELEDSLILKVYNKVSKRIDDGEATAMELVHFLKLGSSQAKLDRERQNMEIQLNREKAKSLARERNIEKLYQNAIKAYSACEYNKDEGPEEDPNEY